ncbi:hypothetical protein AK830_g4872 [Neonectria ditissima]|uniref:ATP-grasp domain-containing protein n=1 Tax=Neonectria ditissima TaxID=78410 RepID=A0A0P7AUW2_9HYPO|nr:hypothetical protein AK830_g4872 [Neonectria ditissima]
MQQGTCQVAVDESNETFDCQWSIRPYTKPSSGPEIGKALCLVLSRANQDAPATSPLRIRRRVFPDADEGKRLRQSLDFETFLVESLVAHEAEPHTRCAFVLPTTSGYVVRSDFMQRRFTGSDQAKAVCGFVDPLQFVKAAVLGKEWDLRKLLESAVAGLLLHNSDSPVGDFGDLLDELDDRITFPWLTERSIQSARVVWVGGRYAVTESARIWDAAYALGISLVIIDEPGNWMEDDSGPHAYYREAFVPMDMTADDGFVDRLLQTVRELQKSMKIDGIQALTDARLAKGAKVSEILRLPTSPSSSFELSTNKGKVLMMEAEEGQVCVYSDFDDFQQRFQRDGLPKALEYPLVVKPCLGWASECVIKVANEEQLIEAASKASARHGAGPLQKPSFMIERYADGPEYDATFVLHNGEVLFLEVADDFPSSADLPGAASEGDFMETENLTPTALPENEFNIIRDSIHRSITRLGFTSGVFNCEGRIVNSSMRYSLTDHRVGDLETVVHNQAGKEPSVFLHEINARVPAYNCTTAAHLTYGVDFYAQSLLFSIGHMERYASLARQFRNGAQWHLAFVHFIPERAGVMKTPDAILQLVESLGDLKSAVVATHTVIKGGGTVRETTSSEPTFIGWILVTSKVSRAECLRLAREIRSRFEYELE